jgi:hypothetical protein
VITGRLSVTGAAAWRGAAAAAVVVVVGVAPLQATSATTLAVARVVASDAVTMARALGRTDDTENLHVLDGRAGPTGYFRRSGSPNVGLLDH